MNISWKELGNRASPRNWSVMAWGVALVVVVCVVGTAVVGAELFRITDHPVGFRPQ